MRRFPTLEERVRILNDIGKEFEDDKIGTVKYRDGDYIMIKLDKSGVLVERYPSEIDSIEIISHSR